MLRFKQFFKKEGTNSSMKSGDAFSQSEKTISADNPSPDIRRLEFQGDNSSPDFSENLSEYIRKSEELSFSDINLFFDITPPFDFAKKEAVDINPVAFLRKKGDIGKSVSLVKPSKINLKYDSRKYVEDFSNGEDGKERKEEDFSPELNLESRYMTEAGRAPLLRRDEEREEFIRFEEEKRKLLEILWGLPLYREWLISQIENSSHTAEDSTGAEDEDDEDIDKKEPEGLQKLLPMVASLRASEREVSAHERMYLQARPKVFFSLQKILAEDRKNAVALFSGYAVNPGAFGFYEWLARIRKDTLQIEDISAIGKVDDTVFCGLTRGYACEIARQAVEAARAVDSRRNKLAEANLRLVVNIAKRYINRGPQFLDLIQEGNIGLFKSIDMFEHLKGFRLSTYATQWIRQSITRAILDTGQLIRVPVHMAERIWKFRKITDKLCQRYKREPTVKEIARSLGRPIKDVEKIFKILAGVSNPSRLDEPIGDSNGDVFGDLIADTKIPTPHDRSEDSDRMRKLDRMLTHLPPREEIIMRLRFGFPLKGKQAQLTLEDLGEKFGMTRERIRQIEAKALKKLRIIILRKGLSEKDFW